MNKNKIHNQKHLTLTERIYIEQELVQGNTFSSIAAVLDKDPSTISKEVKRARIIEDDIIKMDVTFTLRPFWVRGFLTILIYF